jgi:hypothetical protein
VQTENYHPPRQAAPAPPVAPTEIDLVFNVRPCGTCTFFWPPNSADQPYGPYPAYDFDENTPAEHAPPPQSPTSFAWLKGTTRPPAFPNPEVIDGCRKAPIMTIGINPNLTAFAPGPLGASWCYPNFSSDGGTDEWTKFAYYYRYRSVYQERFDLRFAERFLKHEGKIVAPRPGFVTSVPRLSDAPAFTMTVRYDGDAQDTTIDLAGTLGTPRYVVLRNASPSPGPSNRFAQGDVIAAVLDVPAGRPAEIYAEQQAYYEQIVPTLAQFNAFLKNRGHATANVRPGEDVGQLDMVACASPHWGPPWLGGTKDTVSTIIHNCVTTNAWALKQLVQTRPAVLFLVSEASYTMFGAAFGNLIKADPPLPITPEDSDFTLLRATTNPAHPVTFEFATEIDGRPYQISTQIVIAPHFSYNSNYQAQFRLSPTAWTQFQQTYPECAAFLTSDPRIQFQGVASFSPFVAFMIASDALKDAVIAELQTTSPDATAILMRGYYDAHAMLASVLEEAYLKGKLAYTDPAGDNPGYLTRADGPCTFCVNDFWQFPQGCPYDKPAEPQLPLGFLEQVAAQIIATAAASEDAAKKAAESKQLTDVVIKPTSP